MTPSSTDERIDLRVSPDDLKRWRATAAVENLSLSEWIRNRCNEVAVDQETIDVVARKLEERNARMRIMKGERADAIVRGGTGSAMLVAGSMYPSTPTARKELAEEIVEHADPKNRLEGVSVTERKPRKGGR